MKRLGHIRSGFVMVLFTFPFVSHFACSGAGAAASPQIHRFADIYEPSGAIYHPSGDILIVEDNKSTPLYITRFPDKLEKGELKLNPPAPLKLSSPSEDLEGAALGKEGFVFLITSFSTSKKGKRKQKRQRLILLKIEDGQIVHEQYFNTLFESLYQRLTQEKYFSENDIEALNIEGITFNKNINQLLIGLRAPLKKGKSIILSLENPYEIFSKNGSPKISREFIELDLGGGGIRAITYDQTLDTYLIANEVENDKGKLRPRLWTWDTKHKPERLPLPKMKGVKNIEAITPVVVDSRKFLLLLCDDGNRKKEEGAHYILLDYDFLKKF